MSAFSQTLRHKVIIQMPSTGRDEAGQPIEGWTDFANPWADILNSGGMESIKAGRTTAVRQVSIRLRYRLDLDESMRVVHGSTVYKVLAVSPDERQRQHVDLICEVVK